MRQTTLSVSLEVKPESAPLLSTLIDKLHDRKIYDAFGVAVPSVHFLSLSIFPGSDYDPLFVLEANFDGEPRHFWPQLEQSIGDDLRAMLRCCKRPLDGMGALYDGVTRDGSAQGIGVYFEKRTLQPSVFHHGNRGMSRERILREKALFIATREEIATARDPGASPYRNTSAVNVHATLRDAMRKKFPWLDATPPLRVGIVEWMTGLAKLLLFVMAVLFVITAPALILWSLMTGPRYWILLGRIADRLQRLVRSHERSLAWDGDRRKRQCTELHHQDSLPLGCVRDRLFCGHNPDHCRSCLAGIWRKPGKSASIGRQSNRAGILRPVGCDTWARCLAALDRKARFFTRRASDR